MTMQEFSHENCVGRGRDWKVYKEELLHAKANSNATGRTTIVAKQWIQKSRQENNQFQTELDVLCNRKHEDIISLAGYCDEHGETITVYKYVWNGSLDKHLNNLNLTWIKRLQICNNVASGLEFLHGGGVTQKKKKSVAEPTPPARDPCDVETIERLQQRIQELEFSQLQLDSPAEEAKTESNVWDDGSDDVNPFGRGNHGFHDNQYHNPLLTKETESKPII
nr:protein kinase-like domain, phloem protein 2-like protein [Tanacetum cinerariifolium]